MNKLNELLTNRITVISNYTIKLSNISYILKHEHKTLAVYIIPNEIQYVRVKSKANNLSRRIVVRAPRVKAPVMYTGKDIIERTYLFSSYPKSIKTLLDQLRNLILLRTQINNILS